MIYLEKMISLFSKEEGDVFMNAYEKPVVMVNDELAEGVYAASGATCWSITGSSVQNDGSVHIFEFHATHSTSVQHISNGFTAKITFNYNVASVYNQQGSASVSGNVVTATVGTFGNAYGSGDKKEFKLEVSTGDVATTKALSILGMEIYDCDWSANVQGGGQNGE